jgi:hypothetical protein
MQDINKMSIHTKITDKEKKFIAIAERIFRKYHIELDAFKRDNRISGIMETVFYKPFLPEMHYNWKYASHWSLDALTCILLHETFHAIQDRPYDTDEEMIEEEYLAERFALNEFAKMNYPAYEKECNTMQRVLKEKSRRKTMAFDKIHRAAYMRIKEYQS